MRKIIFLAGALALPFILGGCGKGEAPASATPAVGTAAAPREIVLTAGDNMKYNVTGLEAAPGETLHVTLTNIGTMPKEAMGHNWILLKAGSDAAAFSAAAATAKDSEYVPASLQDEILAHIELLGPRKSGEVTFTAPAQPGQYPYLCSFPAHYLTGMKGSLVVK